MDVQFSWWAVALFVLSAVGFVAFAEATRPPTHTEWLKGRTASRWQWLAVLIMLFCVVGCDQIFKHHVIVEVSDASRFK